MRFKFGVCLSILGLIVYSIGVLTPFITDPSLSASGQRKGTFFFFGLLIVAFGLFTILTSFNGKR